MTSPDFVSAWEIAARQLEVPPWDPYPWQIPPEVIATQGMWLIEGGRGIGKTDGCARHMDAHVAGPPCDPRVPGGHRMAIVAPTLDDAAESCVTGPSGLRAHNPAVQLKTLLGGSKALWPSGAEAKLFSGATENDADRLRAGGNRCLVWIEEAAAIRWLDTVVKQARYGLRLGQRPYLFGSSTPKPTKAYKALRAEPTTIRTHGTTADAHHLPDEVRARLYADYAGTRLGRQELLGQLLEDVEGALWTLTMIEAQRTLAGATGDFRRVVVSVDPATTATEESDETGIVACASGEEPGHKPRPSPEIHGYVLADKSGRYSPHEWGETACLLAHQIHADAVVVEDNQGGEMTETIIRDGWSRLQLERRVTGPCPAIRRVHAKQGKRLRAEPIAALYEQQRVHHVGGFEQLEDQMTSWVPGDASPDRLDALVHGLTDLLGAAATSVGRMRVVDRRLAGRR